MSYKKKQILLTLCFFVIGSAFVGCSIKHQTSTKDMYDVLFDGLGMHEKKIKGKLPQLSKSNAGEIQAFLNNFPIVPDNITNDLSFEKNYRFIQSDYSKFFLVFSLGNEPNQWDGKLYNILFNITFPRKEIPEDETRVYRKLKQLHGDYTTIEKFRYDEKKIDEDINVYIWQLPDIVITYRTLYDSERKRTVVVVNYWDNKFYKTHNTYEY